MKAGNEHVRLLHTTTGNQKRNVRSGPEQPLAHEQRDKPGLASCQKNPENSEVM
jgi:hypothetical protein